MVRVIIFGSSGFLGQHLLKRKTPDFELFYVVKLDSSNLCLYNLELKQKSKVFKYDRNNVIKILKEVKPDIIFNSAALANIEKCAANPDLAFLTNAEFPEWLALYASNSKTKLVHFSTDAVFGQNGSFFTETDTPYPVSVYGRSKFEGEDRVLQQDKRALVLRTNFFGLSPKGDSLFDFFYRAFLQNILVHGYVDSLFTPIYIEDLITVTFWLVRNDHAGIFHITGSDRISKFEFGYNICNNFFGKTNLIKPTYMPIRSESVRRNHDLSLDNSKIKSLVGSISSYKFGLTDILNKLNGGNHGNKNK